MLKLPPYSSMKKHTAAALGVYWQQAPEAVEQLPVPRRSIRAVELPLTLVEIELPNWAYNLGVDGRLLVPVESTDREGRDWQSVDWWLAAFLLLEGWHERTFELRHGPIHSYAHRLKGWDIRAWDHAWVNRIGMFLRRWASHSRRVDEQSLLGSVSEAKLTITHDVDALEKTLQIRMKQGAFKAFNVWRRGVSKKQGDRLNDLRELTRFVFGNDDWNFIAETIQLEKRRGVAANFNFHVSPARSYDPIGWLLDPSYRSDQAVTRRALQQVKAAGAVVGLHPSAKSWESANMIRSQRLALENAAEIEVTSIRQHWLKFSWERTWLCQEQAGLVEDFTLMFNDKPGFRNSSAISWNPWCSGGGKAHQIRATPTVLMDSHIYDYEKHDSESREMKISNLVEECKAVHGSAAFLWHPHTLSSDYGWRSGFEYLLDEMTS